MNAPKVIAEGDKVETKFSEEQKAKLNKKMEGLDEEQRTTIMAMITNMKVKTTPRQHNFPSQNQAAHCWNRYNEWVVCMKTTEGDRGKCAGSRQLAGSICPDEWQEKWDEEREEGTFPGMKSKF
uniref:Uncharacterized protein n=1 Tax=Proboscia inermis TaxID=420281 RepID=A0A7S0GB85_9STRA|mmetsp:Transcript_56584/g.66134  ORF Transcript_56584/g.66134 Transcript_56584/m.66134 type:complete len:124 (+) Transcript_56584:87-458(+)